MYIFVVVVVVFKPFLVLSIQKEPSVNALVSVLYLA